MSGLNRLGEAEELVDPNTDAEPSLADCTRALERTADPGEQSDLWRAIARVHLSRCAYTEAEAAMARAVALTPDHPMALSGWATALECLARHQEARTAFERAVAIDPSCDRARVNLSLHYLLHGRYCEAWPFYRSRLGTLIQISLPVDIAPWTVQDTPPELFVVAEQGIGDVVQFCRYAPLLQLASPRVSFLGAAKLHPLLACAGLFQTEIELPGPDDGSKPMIMENILDARIGVVAIENAADDWLLRPDVIGQSAKTEYWNVIDGSIYRLATGQESVNDMSSLLQRLRKLSGE